jgi:DNA-binding NarL/FixJ family response regulator
MTWLTLRALAPIGQRPTFSEECRRWIAHTQVFAQQVLQVQDPHQLIQFFGLVSQQGGLQWEDVLATAEPAPVEPGAIDVLLPPPEESLLREGCGPAPMEAVARHLGGLTFQSVSDAALYKGADHGEFYAAIESYSRRGHVDIAVMRSGLPPCTARFVFRPAPNVAKATGIVVAAQLMLLATHMAESAYAATQPGWFRGALTSPLTPTQAWLLSRMVKGHSRSQIATECHTTQATVLRMEREIVATMQVSGSHAAAARAMHMQWLNQQLLDAV